MSRPVVSNRIFPQKPRPCEAGARRARMAFLLQLPSPIMMCWLSDSQCVELGNMSILYIMAGSPRGVLGKLREGGYVELSGAVRSERACLPSAGRRLYTRLSRHPGSPVTGFLLLDEWTGLRQHGLDLLGPAIGRGWRIWWVGARISLHRAGQILHRVEARVNQAAHQRPKVGSAAVTSRSDPSRCLTIEEQAKSLRSLSCRRDSQGGSKATRTI